MSNNNEPIKGVIYYKLDSEYNGDITRNCGLKSSEVDGNFYFLRGNDIDHAEWDQESSFLLNLVKVNGEKIEVNLSGITSNISVEGTYFDKEKGILHLFVNGEDHEIEGFEIRTIYTEIPEASKTGFFAPVKELIDITNGEKLPENPNVGDRFLTKESINKFGFLYNFKGAQEVIEKLKKENSTWRVPSNDEWGEMLNAIELCDDDRNHVSNKSNVDLGLNAGAFLKKDGEGWKVSNEAAQPDEIEKSFGFKVNPVGGIGIAAPQNINSNIQYQGESTEFWTSSVLENSDIWARRFDYNKDTVRQQAEGSDTFCSIRLIANKCNKKNTRVETINGLPYNVVSMPSVKVNDKKEIFDGDNYFWTVENVSIPVSEGNYFPVNLSDDANEIYYFINYWNGNEWEKETFKEYSIVYVEDERKDKRLINNELKDFITSESGSTGGDYDKEIEDINKNLSSLSSSISDNSKKITELDNTIGNKADKDHNHDEIYAKKEIEDKVEENATAITEIKTSISEIDNKVSDAVKDFKIKNVSENDKILSLNDGILKSEISLEYNSEDNFIKLLGKGGEVISSFNTSVFLKDGMLENAEIVNTNGKGEKGTFIKFAFNTDAGSKIIYLDAASLVDEYTAGNGLTLNNNTFSIDDSIVATKQDLGEKANIEHTHKISEINDLESKLGKIGENALSITALQDSLKNKVDTEEGKGLSSNDYTATEKSKLESIAEGAQANVIENVKVNGVTLPVDGKAVNVEIPSLDGYAKEEFVEKAKNDAITASTAYTKTEIDTIKQDIANKSNINHKHLAEDITGGTFSIRRIPTGTSDTTVAIGSHVHDNYAEKTDVKNLQDKVGDSTKGLIKDVADNAASINEINAKLGDDQSGLSKDVADLKTTVGTAESGLVKDIADLKAKDTEINGNLTIVSGKVDTNAKAIESLKTTVGEVKVKNVDADDKILSLSEAGFVSAKVSLSYGKGEGENDGDLTGTTYIKLLGKDNAVISQIDASAFIKDGVLNKVSYDPESKNLKITFNTDAGKSDINVDLSSLVDVYAAKDKGGLKLEGNKFSLQLNENDPYLGLDANGNLASKGIGDAISALTSGKLDTTVYETYTGATETKITEIEGEISNNASKITEEVSNRESTIKDLSDEIAKKANTADVVTYRADGASIEQTNSDSDKTVTFAVKEVAQDKVSGLADTLAGKVDKAEDSRLMTNAEGTKLAGIKEGAEKNIINEIQLDGTTITPSDKGVVNIKTITGNTGTTSAIIYNGSDTIQITNAEGEENTKIISVKVVPITKVENLDEELKTKVNKADIIKYEAGDGVIKTESEDKKTITFSADFDFGTLD